MNEYGAQFPALTRKYPVIYCDPPWEYDDAIRGEHLEDHHYSPMNLKELTAMGSWVREISAPGALLFMWTTGPQMEVAMPLMRGWGFSYKTIAFIWEKTRRSGKEFMGGGSYTRANREYCIVGRCKGKGIPRLSRKVRQGITAHYRGHSVKPFEVRAALETLYGPNAAKLELFTREETVLMDKQALPNHNWDSWTFSGLEYDNCDYKLVGV